MNETIQWGSSFYRTRKIFKSYIPVVLRDVDNRRNLRLGKTWNDFLKSCSYLKRLKVYLMEYTLELFAQTEIVTSTEAKAGVTTSRHGVWIKLAKIFFDVGKSCWKSSMITRWWIFQKYKRWNFSHEHLLFEVLLRRSLFSVGNDSGAIISNNAGTKAS